MKQEHLKLKSFRLIDMIPAVSGLIGKTALVTSFAVVWAKELGIQNPDFVFENVRLEMIIGSMITLIAALWLPGTAPSGTLAPLIVLIPSMVSFGVHPFVLSLLVGFLGLISLKTKLFFKLLSLSGVICKTSLTLTIGISGVLMSVKSLLVYFEGSLKPFFLIMAVLTVTYLLLFRWNKTWLIIPAGAMIAMLISVLSSIRPDFSYQYRLPAFLPSFWWNQMWGIGFGLDLTTIMKTLPYAIFIIILWTIDTVSINVMMEASQTSDAKKTDINLNRSFTVTSLRNMIGGFFGGAQTSALWRSYLIPLFMMKRPMGPSSIILGLSGILFGIAALPIKILSFPPLIWSVLLFGIFLPFIIVGIQNVFKLRSYIDIAFLLFFTAAGIAVSPILSWFFTILYEKIRRRLSTS